MFYILLFKLSFPNLVCILYLTSQLGLTTFQGLSSHMWLVATALDSAGIKSL